MHTYIVQKGESVRSVSRKFSVPEAALLRENQAPFYEGQSVSVPVDILSLPPDAARYAQGYFQVPASSVVTLGETVDVIFT